PYRHTFDPKAQPSSDALAHARQLQSTPFRLNWIKPWDVTTGLDSAQLDHVKRTLARNWPVCAGLRWPKQENWKKNTLEMAPPEGVRDGHSVLFVGFRDDASQPGGGVFIFRNTAKAVREGQMTYEYARAYINDAAWIDFAPEGGSGPDLQPAAKAIPA